MTTRRQVKLVREGRYVAEVEVELIEGTEGWAPYLSLEDALKLDAVREVLHSLSGAAPSLDRNKFDQGT